MTEQELLRSKIVGFAEAEIGPQVKGSPQVFGYWREVLPPSWSDVVVRKYAAEKHWCGGFALWCLHQAGVAKDVFWLDGLGFTEVQKLPRTKDPQPGDIAYTDKPFQHHAVVHSLADGTLITIDGNQPNVVRKKRPLPTAITFYSIQPFLNKLSEPQTEYVRATLNIGANNIGAVQRLQTLLNRAIVHSETLPVPLKVDGDFGPKTDKVVRGFQAIKGLKVDGIVGKATWAALEAT